jgi:large subunit ribosomal protein L9
VKVILVKDIPDLGQKGEIKEVASGYARNYLIPKGFALKATPGCLNDLKLREETKAQKAVREINEAQEVAKKLTGKSFTIKVKAGEEGRLFGSVTSADIAKTLSSEGINIDKRKVELTEHIKELGSYSVRIKLHSEVVVSLDVKVEELQQ